MTSTVRLLAYLDLQMKRENKNHLRTVLFLVFNLSNHYKGQVLPARF